MEKQYIRCFCEEEDLGNYFRYKDDLIKDMYSHNFIMIDHRVSEAEIQQIIEKEILYRRHQGKRFLRLMTSAPISERKVKNIHPNVDIEVYDYFAIQAEDHHVLKAKDKAIVRIADNDSVKRDAVLVDVIANYKGMTLEFASRRIERKLQVYSDKRNELNIFVCYDDIEPVGNCELLIGDKIAKIEDFDIMEIHQKKGFGTYVLKSLLERCYEKGIEAVYLVTDHDDTAKEMYKKNGFKCIGNRTEMMFHL